MELLAEVGFDALTVDAVAARAGVSRPTVYRRWPSKVHLVTHVLLQAAVPPPLPRTGSAREDLREFVELVVTGLVSSSLGWAVLAAAAEARREPELGDQLYERFIATRHAQIDAIVERGVADGELRTDLDADVVRDLVVGPLIYHWFATGEPMPADRVDQLFEVLWPMFSSDRQSPAAAG
jgi:AcrR family transcriptional regulator